MTFNHGGLGIARHVLARQRAWATLYRACRDELESRKKKRHRLGGAFEYGGSCRIRTYDQLVKSQLLYQLS